jgi:uncharacterized protein YndB with AHSA1/START domain
MAQHNLQVNDSIEINASPDLVFSYFTNAQKIAKWWSKSASCDPRQNGTLIFNWENGTSLETQFKIFRLNDRLYFPFGPEFVEVIFKANKSKTILSVCHSNIIIENDDFSLLIHITQSWNFLLINLKMVIEHQIDLR